MVVDFSNKCCEDASVFVVSDFVVFWRKFVDGRKGTAWIPLVELEISWDATGFFVAFNSKESVVFPS
jgi:hypothetical protein